MGPDVTGTRGKGGGCKDDLRELDRLLRGDLTHGTSLMQGEVRVDPARLSRILIVLCMAHGAFMGTFALFSRKSPDNWLQVLASMVKVPMLFYLTLLVTLPSLYVFNALVGSRLTLRAVVRLLVATLGVNVAVLSSLGPIVAFFSVSTTSYPFMILLNVAVFAVAGLLGQLFLLQTLQKLSEAQTRAILEPAAEPPASELIPTTGAILPPGEQALSRHVKTIFRLWLFVFGLVGAQMGWVLRPFVGNPHGPFAWFRGRESNFFQAVLHTIGNLFG